ncbi:hypothetical protein XANCAGTX0491_002726 [Xanthoria calcicola]
MATSTLEEPHSVTQSQYHHYVPRFLLRNYAVHKDGSKPSTKKSGKGKSTQPQNLNLLDLVSGELKQTWLSKNFGLQDMYRDFDKSNPDQHKLEKQLSVLEDEVSQILRTVKARFEVGKAEVQLSRKEKGKLRKFLFIMLYRNRTLHSRFNKSKEEYDDVDRQQMLQYMEEKGFKHPRDVWFANTSAFLNADIDINNDKPADTDHVDALLQALKTKLESQAYPPDAQWFWYKIQGSFLSFCTPKAKEDEFLMTQNAYSVFEGPNDTMWMDYHAFAPITPRLMMVTRSNLLRKVSSVEQQSVLDSQLNGVKSMHGGAGSCLEDLPVTDPENNYSRWSNGEKVLSATKMSPDKHIFYFKFFAIRSKHVQRINTVLLEEAIKTETLAYKSRTGLLRALAAYLRGDTPGFQAPWLTTVSSTATASGLRLHDQRLIYVRMLRRVAQGLGSQLPAGEN